MFKSVDPRTLPTESRMVRNGLEGNGEEYVCEAETSYQVFQSRYRLTEARLVGLPSPQSMLAMYQEEGISAVVGKKVATTVDVMGVPTGMTRPKSALSTTGAGVTVTRSTTGT